MRSPGSRLEQLVLLGEDQRADALAELGEDRVGVDRLPMMAAIGVVLELPEMDQLVEAADVGLEVADKPVGEFVVPGEFPVDGDGFGHLADVERKIGRASCRERVCQYV